MAAWLWNRAYRIRVWQHLLILVASFLTVTAFVAWGATGIAIHASEGLEDWIDTLARARANEKLDTNGSELHEDARSEVLETVGLVDLAPLTEAAKAWALRIRLYTTTAAVAAQLAVYSIISVLAYKDLEHS